MSGDDYYFKFDSLASPYSIVAISANGSKFIYNLLFNSCRFALLRLRKTIKSTVNLPIILHYGISITLVHPQINHQSLVSLLPIYCLCSAMLVDLFSPSFVYNFDIKWFILYFVFFACITLLDDRFFRSRHLNTLVSGLLYIYFNLACVLVVVIFLETFVFAGLSFVKCCHIGLLFSFASSLTRFML